MEYSEKSDCFSFAITVTEIIEQKLPHSSLQLLSAAEAIRKGLVPKLTDAYPEWLKSLLIKCWSFEASDRPSMSQVLDVIADNMGDQASGDDTESE